MKIYLLLSFCLVLFFSCSETIKFNFTECVYTPPADVEMPVVEHPFKIFDWIKNNMTYYSDVGENWQSPHESVERKKGDCEDPVILSMYYFQKFGYEPYLITVIVEGNKALHSILEINKFTWVDFRVSNSTYTFYSHFIVPRESYKEHHRYSWQEVLIAKLFLY